MLGLRKWACVEGRTPQSPVHGLPEDTSSYPGPGAQGPSTRVEVGQGAPLLPAAPLLSTALRGCWSLGEAALSILVHPYLHV